MGAAHTLTSTCEPSLRWRLSSASRMFLASSVARTAWGGGRKPPGNSGTGRPITSSSFQPNIRSAAWFQNVTEPWRSQPMTANGDASMSISSASAAPFWAMAGAPPLATAGASLVTGSGTATGPATAAGGSTGDARWTAGSTGISCVALARNARSLATVSSTDPSTANREFGVFTASVAVAAVTGKAEGPRVWSGSGIPLGTPVGAASLAAAGTCAVTGSAAGAASETVWSMKIQ